MDIIGRGAEGVVMRTPEGIVKTRLPKAYRHPLLDKHLRETRTRAEGRILGRARLAGVTVPSATATDAHTLQMDEIPGVQVKQVLDETPQLAVRIGEMVAKLHDADIIHADLTTSNMLYDPATNVLTMIDFGLSYHSERVEDKAVDLHLMRQSLESKHHRIATMAWREFLRGYRASAHVDAVLDRLKKVEARGRNKGS